MADNNIIEKDGDMIGFYDDLVASLRGELIKLLQEEKGAPDPGALGTYSEIIEELERLREYGGLIVITDNNGMGWTAKKYQYKED